MQHNIEKNKTCCFTGHRFIPYSEKAAVEKRLGNVIERLAAEGYTTFVSGGAIGFDSMAAKIVLRLRENIPHIRLVMALPCKDQHVRWSLRDQKKYEYILRCADEVIYLNETYCTGCMHKRNRFMIDNSSFCVAYLTSKTGGTAYTIKYAEESNVEVINLA